VGIATEPYGGLVLRRMDNNDQVLFAATPDGPRTGPIDFFHLNDDCSDSRYVYLSYGSGFAFFAQINRGTAYYTKTQDPSFNLSVEYHSFEHFEAGDDWTQRLTSNCTVSAGTGAIGVATSVADSVLSNLPVPLRLK